MQQLNRSVLISCSFVGLLLTILVSNSGSVNGANILGVFTSHSPSHLIIHMSVMKALAEDGHNVTIVATSKPKVTHESIKEIIIPLSEEEEKKLHEGMGGMVKEKPSTITTIINMFGSLSLLFDKQIDVLEDNRFIELYENKDNKFDAVIFGFFFNTYQAGFGAKFNCPVIMSWSAAQNQITDELIGNPNLVSTVPNMLVSVENGKAMNFQERVVNFLSTSTLRVFGLLLERKNSQFYKRLMSNDPGAVSYEEAKKNITLVFCSTHAISEGPIRPNVPSLIEIGGIQVKDKPNPLPEDIQKFLDGAKHGAILFSLGSNLKGDHIKPETVNIIFKTLSSLKQRVIWKWEDSKNTPGKSANILYKKWMPQDDILAHPKIKLFITHAGKGGVTESLFHAKPMLAMPVFADQPGNADKLVQHGYGLRVDLLTLEENEFKSALKEILENPSYTNEVKQFSKLYRDRPMTPRETVVYWTNYVLRHHGAAHMQSPLIHMNFIESNNVDVYFLLVTAFIIICLINIIIFKFLWSKCCGGKNKAHKKVKKQ